MREEFRLKKKSKPFSGLRNLWERKPTTQVVPNKKAYNRSEEKKNLRKELECFC